MEEEEQVEPGALTLDFLCHVNKFPAGVSYITPGAEQAIADSGEQVLPYLCAHVAGNWGYVSEADGKHNDEAVKTGGRIHSVYRTKKDKTIWVITEADRSATTILLPEEY